MMQVARLGTTFEESLLKGVVLKEVKGNHTLLHNFTHNEEFDSCQLTPLDPTRLEIPRGKNPLLILLTIISSVPTIVHTTM